MGTAPSWPPLGRLGITPADGVGEKRIANGEAKKPDDWGDEVDGGWEAPMKWSGPYWANELPPELNEKNTPESKGEWCGQRTSDTDTASSSKDDFQVWAKYLDFGWFGLHLWQRQGGPICGKVIEHTESHASKEIGEGYGKKEEQSRSSAEQSYEEWAKESRRKGNPWV